MGGGQGRRRGERTGAEAWKLPRAETAGAAGGEAEAASDDDAACRRNEIFFVAPPPSSREQAEMSGPAQTWRRT